MAKSKLPIQFDDLRLTQKEQEFLLLYATNGYDAVKAYREAKLGRKDLSDIEIRLEASALVNKREIKVGVQRFTASVVDPYKDMLMVQLLESDRHRSFYDIGEFIDDAGHPIPLSKLTREQRISIDEVDVQYFGKDDGRKVIRYKMANKEIAKKNLRTMLKISEDGESTKTESTNEARTRVSEIFKAGLLGVKEGEKRARAELKKATLPSDSVEVEFVEEDENGEIPVEPLYVATARQALIEETIHDEQVNAEPVVQRAKELLKGLNLPQDHPLFMKGRELAEARIKAKAEKENK